MNQHLVGGFADLGAPNYAKNETMLQQKAVLLRIGIAFSVTAIGFFAIAFLIFSQSVLSWIPFLHSVHALKPDTIQFSCLTIMICLSLGSLLIPERSNLIAELADFSVKAASDSSKSFDAKKLMSAHLNLILAKLRNHTELTGTYSGVLESVGKNLIELTTPEQLRLAIGYLIAQNKKMHEDTIILQSDLTVSNLKMENLRQNLEQAEEEGSRDHLTATWNRRAFEKMLDAQIADSMNKDSPLSMIFADIDYFKRINDKFGHLIGDEVLKLVAGTISQNIKGKDLVARFGGEEFAIILPETTLVNAIHIADQIRQKLENQNWISRQHKEPIGVITASFGVSQFQKGEKKSNFLHRTDEKLYKAKNSGRNTVAG